MPRIRDVSLPGAGSTNWYEHYASMDATLRGMAAESFRLDDYDGTDDEKLTAAIEDQQAATDRNMPVIVLPSRPMTFTTPRVLYSGLKIMGSAEYSGQKNPDISGGSRSGPECTLAGSIGSGTSSWWRSPGGDVNNILFANFQVQGSQGASTHQFLDYAGGGSMYPASFHSLSFNFMRGVFGRSDRKALMTQVTMTGDWTINNCWDTPIHVGGSDFNISPSMMNIGVSQSAAQTGDVNRYFLKLDTAEVTLGEKIYISAMNGWRGVLISGNSSVDWHGGIIEGFKPTRTNGLLAGPGPGSLVKITGGSVNFFGTKIGQGMDNPDASEGALIDISGATTGEATTEVGLHGVQLYGRNLGTVAAIRHTGGRLYATVTRRTSETGVWSGRPRVATAALLNTGAYSYVNPDQSLRVL